MDVVVTCDNKAGMPITFKTVDEAKKYLEEYYDTLELDVRDTPIGTEFHLVPMTNKQKKSEDLKFFILLFNFLTKPIIIMIST